MSKTKLMGILNVTPDSFFDSGSFFSTELAISRGQLIEKQGADLIDIGGESSRPGAKPISEEEELTRVIPVIKALHQTVSIPLSIDTTKPRVALAALEAGATMINDITGLSNPEMCEIAQSFGVDVCVMHMQKKPELMQIDPFYPEGIVSHLLQWFNEKIEKLTKLGFKNKQIILDPGIGFGKTVADNLKIIHNLAEFKKLGFPLLLGVSRKSFLGKLVNKPVDSLLPATVAMNAIAILEKTDIIRVHDISEHRDIINLLNSYQLENITHR